MQSVEIVEAHFQFLFVDDPGPESVGLRTPSEQPSSADSVFRDRLCPRFASVLCELGNPGGNPGTGNPGTDGTYPRSPSKETGEVPVCPQVSPPGFAGFLDFRAGSYGFTASEGGAFFSLASASSTRFLKSPWSLCESPLYIDTTLISHVVPIGNKVTWFLPWLTAPITDQ